MEISGRITQNQHSHIKGGKISSPSGSPFGSDKVQIGGKQDQFGLTQSQMKRFFTTGKKDVKSEELWKFERPDPGSYDSILPGKGNSIFAPIKDGIVKLDGFQGDKEWSVKLKSPLLKQSSYMFEGKDGTVISACEDNRLHGLDPDTGSEIWSFDLGYQFKNPAKVLDNGDILAFRKVGDKLHLSRLNPDGSLKNSVELGWWDEPIGDDGCGAIYVSQEKNGNVLVHAGVKEKKPGKKFAPLYNKTFSVSPDGKVNWERRNLEPPNSFPSDPDNFFMTDYECMAGYDKHTGKEIWKLEHQDESFHPSVGKFRAGVIEIDGEPRYKYIKFINSQKGRLIIQGYMEGPLRKSKSGEELICMDPRNPDKIFWKKPTDSSVFTGPIYNDDSILLHISDEETGTVEALDPITGKSKWSQPLKDPNSGQRVKGRQGNMVTVSSEIPDNYSVKKAQDGTLFIRTFKNIFGIEPKTGSIKYKIKSKIEISDFCLDEENGTIIAVNNEDSSIQAFPIHPDGNAVSMATKRIAGKDKQEEISDLTIEMGENEVHIGGVTLPINKRGSITEA